MDNENKPIGVFKFLFQIFGIGLIHSILIISLISIFSDTEYNGIYVIIIITILFLISILISSFIYIRYLDNKDFKEKTNIEHIIRMITYMMMVIGSLGGIFYLMFDINETLFIRIGGTLLLIVTLIIGIFQLKSEFYWEKENNSEIINENS